MPAAGRSKIGLDSRQGLFGPVQARVQNGDQIAVTHDLDIFHFFRGGSLHPRFHQNRIRVISVILLSISGIKSKFGLTAISKIFSIFSTIT
jgi:hypothetical protein